MWAVAAIRKKARATVDERRLHNNSEDIESQVLSMCCQCVVNEGRSSISLEYIYIDDIK